MIAWSTSSATLRMLAVSGALRGRQLLAEHLQRERDAGQFLAQPVVQVLTDPPLLLAPDLQDLPLQPPPLGEVAEHAGEHPPPATRNSLTARSQREHRAVLAPRRRPRGRCR